MFTMMTFSYLLMTLLGFLGLFLIGLILLQRGRGGGLAGAFGGMGGQSAFGTKAGDVFTRITIGVASAWILLCAGSVLALHFTNGTRFTGGANEPSIDVKKAEPKDEDKGNVAPADMKPNTSAGPAKKDDDKPAATDEKKDEDKKPEDKKAEEKKAEEKPAEADKPKADKPKDEAKPKEDAKPAEDAKPKDAADAEKKPAEEKPAEPKPEPKAE